MQSAPEGPRRGERVRVAGSRARAFKLAWSTPKRAPKAAAASGEGNEVAQAGAAGVNRKRKREAAVSKRLPAGAAEFLEPLFAANNNKLAWPKPKERLALAGMYCAELLILF